MITHVFEGVSETYHSQVRKRHPWKVTWTVEGVGRRRKHFTTREAAEKWEAWAKEVVNVPLPKGVTLDLRYKKPFLARTASNRRRKMHYCATVAEAESWLQVNRLTT